MADKVGFIRHLPHELVAAFKSTLQEASEAELLLHVIDSSAEDRDDTLFEVDKVLEEIGAGKVRQLQVYNKIDLLADREPRIDRDEHGLPIRVWVSAQKNLGIDLLLQALAELFANTKVSYLCRLLPTQGGIRAKLFEHTDILSEEFNEQGGWNIQLEMDKKHLGLLKSVEIEEVL